MPFKIVTHCEHCRYSVIPKTKKCLEDIDKFIRENHFDECGIIYCLSRMDCEKVSEKLQVGLSHVTFFLMVLSINQRYGDAEQYRGYS